MAVESAAEEAGMMEEGKVPVILAPFFLVSSFTPSFIISFIHSWHVFVCYCQNLKTGRENSNHANQQMGNHESQFFRNRPCIRIESI